LVGVVGDGPDEVDDPGRRGSGRAAVEGWVRVVLDAELDGARDVGMWAKTW